ncbi:MAG: sodium:glutamate symporter, partial [Candidatus Electrothrix sp. AR5]|nr:sodium:glutamate symporter [Candidatus Electrothrix sp. AR5]
MTRLLPVLFFLLIPLSCFGAEEGIHLTAQDPFVAILYLSLFLFAGYAFKAIFLRGLMVPSSLLGGLIALSFGPELLGPVFGNLFGASESGFLSPETLLFWKKSPTFLITIVFAGLFLGNKVPSLKQVLKQGAPNLFFGYSLAFGQYVVGLALVVFLLKPMFGISDLAGALIAIGFQGGHGTAAGMGATFSKLGFPAGMDLGLALATIGLASSIIIGTLILNISGLAKNAERVDIKDEESVSSKDEPLHEGGEDRPDIANSLPFHIGVFGFVISIGWLMQQLFITIDQFLSGGEATIMGYVPLFPIAMIAGLIFQFFVERFGF